MRRSTVLVLRLAAGVVGFAGLIVVLSDRWGIPGRGDNSCAQSFATAIDYEAPPLHPSPEAVAESVRSYAVPKILDEPFKRTVVSATRVEMEAGSDDWLVRITAARSGDSWSFSGLDGCRR